MWHKLIVICIPSLSQPFLCRSEQPQSRQHWVSLFLTQSHSFLHFCAAKKQRAFDMQPASWARAHFPFSLDWFPTYTHAGEIDWVADGRLIERNVHQEKAIYSRHTLCRVLSLTPGAYHGVYPPSRGRFSPFQMRNWDVCTIESLLVSEIKRVKDKTKLEARGQIRIIHHSHTSFILYNFNKWYVP